MTKTPTQRVDLGSHQLVYFEDVDDDSDRLYVRAELARELAAELEATQQTIYARNREIGAILDRAESAERTLAERDELLARCVALFADVHNDICAFEIEQGEIGCSCGSDALIETIEAAIRNAEGQASRASVPSQEGPGPASPAPDEALIEEIVSRFLKCPLPSGVRVDRCATMPECPNRTGTNLLTASEAKEMFTQILSGIKRV